MGVPERSQTVRDRETSRWCRTAMSPPDFRACLDERDGAAIVTVSGEHDAFTAPRLEEVLFGALQGPRRAVVVDLGRLSFMGAAGLNMLIRAHKVLAAQGRDPLVVRSVPPFVAKLFQLTGMDGVLRVERDGGRTAPRIRVAMPHAGGVAS